jgi:hypothetical protein
MREFLLRGPLKERSLLDAAGAAFLLIVALLPLSDVAVPQEVPPTSEPDPGYNDVVAKHLKDTLKNLASLDAFAISAFRWVSSLKGWSWMTCVRQQYNQPGYWQKIRHNWPSPLWRRSAVPWGGTIGCAGVLAGFAVPFATLSSAPIARSNKRRCPSDATPIFSRS